MKAPGPWPAADLGTCVGARRWLFPIDIATKEQLERAGIHTVAAERYVITVADEDNPVCVPGNTSPETVKLLEANGETVAFMEWDEKEKCWVDPVSGNKQFSQT